MSNSIDKIIKIGLISDTHMRLSANAFNTLSGQFDTNKIYQEQELFKSRHISIKQLDKHQLKNIKCSLIIHAGDVGNQSIINTLNSICPVKAVNGNCDFSTFKTLDGQTKDFEYFEYEGCPIAVSHIPSDLQNAISGTFFRPSMIPEDCPIPILRINGHTHEAIIDTANIKKDGYVTICPGSATQGRYGTPNSVGFVYLVEGLPILGQLVNVR